MKKYYFFVTITTLIALFIGLGTIFGSGIPISVSLFVGETFALTVFHFSICVLFLLGLKSFKAQFRHAYLFVCGGIIVNTLAMLQYTVLGAIGALDSWWATSGAIQLPFVIGLLPYFAGLLLLAKLLNLSHLRRYSLATVCVAFFIAALATQIPTPRHDISSYNLMVSAFIFSIQGTLLASFAILVYRIRQKTGGLYIPVFAWLFISFLIYTLQVVCSIAALFLLPNDHWYSRYGINLLFLFAAVVTLYRAALALNRLRFSEPLPEVLRFSFFGKPLVRGKHEASHSSIDAIIYLAGLASNPEAINPILNKLRQVTASLDPQGQLSGEQTQVLVKTYQQLEKYLVTKEPIRNYNAPALRQKVIARFHDPDEKFWAALAPSNPSKSPLS